ncbi:MAG: hypothetical protein H6922_05430 [Pseudomonadaceae bacterium]|nr:hypothetical protein [Pseudomonadaceae bacterium]
MNLIDQHAKREFFASLNIAGSPRASVTTRLWHVWKAGLDAQDVGTRIVLGLPLISILPGKLAQTYGLLAATYTACYGAYSKIRQEHALVKKYGSDKGQQQAALRGETYVKEWLEQTDLALDERV